MTILDGLVSSYGIKGNAKIGKRRERTNSNTNFNKDLAGFMVFPMKIVGHESTKAEHLNACV